MNSELHKSKVRCSAFSEVSKLDNQQLRYLLKEIREISQIDKPSYAKQSDIMKQLFDLEKTDFYSWYDQFSNVKRAIEVEILWRVRTDAL